ncbi:MAG: hypothetical protein NZ853_01075 [Leptospiraceae bacterium]|nr:hypothetical protein [Leptospiraceae bacterium]
MSSFDLENLKNWKIPTKKGTKSWKQEILEEIAFSLKKSEEQLRKSLDECSKIYENYRNAKSSEEKTQYRNQYQIAREKALTEKWKFMVQREAIGLRWTDEFEKRYPTPPLIEDQ